MKIPDKLPIRRMEDYHTHYLGKSANGNLFWGYQTFVYIKAYSEINKGEDLRKYRREYVLVHSFDKEGNYLATNHFSAMTIDTDEHELDNKLQVMVADLGSIEFHDIEIKLFQMQVDGIIFGLIVDEETGMINLEPGSTISFQEPWDGEYYT